VLEQLRERKRILLRATLIDNETYRRAMKVENYNEGRSLRDITDSTKTPKIRGDGYWYDDRYNPTIYPSADQNTNVVLGYNPIYNDVLGGNRIENIMKTRKDYESNQFVDFKYLEEKKSSDK
jgi:hypothetical protein